MQEGVVQEAKPNYNYYVEETPYYRPPMPMNFQHGQVVSEPNVVSQPDTKAKSKLGLYALAGLIGVLTLGSVIYSKD